MGQLRLPMAFMDKIRSSMTWDQVTLANASQPRDYTVVVPKNGDYIFQVTNKYDGGNIIITDPYVYTILSTCFPYKDL
jgi:hypothetical protein